MDKLRELTILMSHKSLVQVAGREVGEAPQTDLEIDVLKQQTKILMKLKKRRSDSISGPAIMMKTKMVSLVGSMQQAAN